MHEERDSKDRKKKNAPFFFLFILSCPSLLWSRLQYIKYLFLDFILIKKIKQRRSQMVSWYFSKKIQGPCPWLKHVVYTTFPFLFFFLSRRQIDEKNWANVPLFLYISIFTNHSHRPFFCFEITYIWKKGGRRRAQDALEREKGENMILFFFFSRLFLNINFSGNNANEATQENSMRKWSTKNTR